MCTRRRPASSISKFGHRVASSSMAMRLSARASAAPRQLCTPWPKPMATLWRPLDVEVVGPLERPRVAGGGAGEQQHREALGDGAAVEVAVGDREATLVLRRRVVAEDLLDRAGDLVAVVEHLLPLVGVAGEQHDRVADQLGHRLGPGPADEGGEAGDLGVVEAGLGAVAAVDGDLGQARQHVVGRVLPLLDGQLVEVHAHRHDGLVVLGAGLGLARLAVEAGVEPVADLLALGRRARRACGR